MSAATRNPLDRNPGDSNRGANAGPNPVGPNPVGRNPGGPNPAARNPLSRDDAAFRNLNDDLRLAHLLADDADSITMSRFKALDLHVTSKPDLTPVTDADTNVEEVIRRTLGRARPRDAVHGEEMADTGWGPR